VLVASRLLSAWRVTLKMKAEKAKKGPWRSTSVILLFGSPEEASYMLTANKDVIKKRPGTV